MKIFYKVLLTISALLAFSMSYQVAAQSTQDIKEYCQSMIGPGISEEDAQLFLNDCIAEQSSYLEPEVVSEQYQEPVYEETQHNETQYDEAQPEEYNIEQNCYEKADEHIQKLMDTDPNTDFDYDQLIEQCLKGQL